MKRIHLVALAGAGLAQAALAQGSVGIYGVLDTGLTHLTSGPEKVVANDGIIQGNRLGFRGTEDLGGGLATLFTLEMGLNINNGTIPGGMAFGRQSWLGVSDRDLGTLSFGRQYEFTWDFVTIFTIGSRVGGYAFHPGDYDRLAGTLRLNNSIKYTSPAIGGLRFGALYALGEKTDLRASAIGATYANGPFAAAFAANHTYNLPLAPANQLGAMLPGLPASIPNDEVRNAAVAASYATGRFQHRGVFTDTRIATGTASARLRTFEVSEVVKVSTPVSVSVGASHTTTPGLHWTNLSGVVDYALSRRTDVYFSVTHGTATRGVKQVFLAVPAATGESLTATRIGVRHLF